MINSGSCGRAKRDVDAAATMCKYSYE